MFLFSALFLGCLCANILHAKNTFFAPDDKYLQTVWTTEDGLPQNSINAVLQSRDGYLWIATFGGLARFDGAKFTTFNSGNTPGLMSNRITSMCEDRSGTLWLATETGEIMSFRNGTGKTYTAADGLPQNGINKILEAQDGTIWTAGAQEITRFDNGKFIVYKSGSELPGWVWNIEDHGDDGLWILTDKGIVKYIDGKFSPISPPESFHLSSELLTQSRKKENVWVNTANGLAIFSDGKLTPYPNSGAQLSPSIKILFEDDDGTLWIPGALPGGIYVLKDGLASIYSVKAAGQGVIKNIFKDREGNLWLGSNGNGLIQLKERKLTTYSTANNLPDDAVRAIVGDGHNGVWISSYAGLTHLQNGRMTNYTDKNGLASNELGPLWLDREGGLWIGSNIALTLFKDEKFTSYPMRDKIYNAKVSAIFEDRAGNLWIGTTGGLLKMRDSEFTAFFQNDGLVNNNISFITETRDGALWIATSGGVSRFENGKFTNFTTADGLSINYVRDIYEEPNGALWFGTYGGGLNRLKDGKFKAVMAKNGLYDDFISRILPDDRGNLWTITNRGIFRVSLAELDSFADDQSKTLTVVSYNVADGMLSSEANGGNQPAGWRTPDGRMWFPTIKGVAVIAADVSSVVVPPPVIIEKVTLDRNEIPFDEALDIYPAQENLEIEYTGINFSRPEQIKFKYRLIGLDTDWTDAGARRTSYFSHLPSGTYTFEVMAESGDGISSETTAQLKIIVHPPFWKTWWFGLICAVIGALAISGIVRARILRLQRAQLAQEDFSRRLINAHESERRRIAAELHDGLGHSLAMIKNSASFAAELDNIPAPAKQQIDQISEQTRQAISEVREISYNLRPYLLDYLGLTKAIQSLLNRIAAATLIEINSEIDAIDNLFGDEAEMSIYRIIQESLNNVLKHANANEVLVIIRKQAELLIIMIRDDGKGFDQPAETLKSNPGGFGLLGITERVRMLGGSYAIKSAPGAGTELNISIRLNENGKDYD